MVDIDELKRLAEKATPGPWVKSAPGEVSSADYEYGGEVMCDHIASGFGCGSSDPDDAAFVAAANPAAVLELIDDIERLREDSVSVDTAVYIAEQLSVKVEQAERERDQIRARLDDPDYPPKHSRRLIAQLRAEVEALRTQGIPAGFYRELVALRELRNQVRAYVHGYLQDEIEDVDCCVSEDQHLSANILNDRLNEAFAACWEPAMATKEGE